MIEATGKSDIEMDSKATRVDKPIPMKKNRIMKNLLVVCLGFLLLFSAFQSLANLQSTMNSEAGIGVASQSLIYAALIVSSMFLPTIIIRRLGCKRTLVLSILTYCPYIAANFYPHWGTFMPAALLLGLGASPLWSSKCIYLNEIGHLYASYVGETVDSVVSRFFGVFFMIFQNTQIWGNLASYYVLKPNNETAYQALMNSSQTPLYCGSDFCPGDDDNSTNPNLEPPSDSKRFTLIGIYLTCALLAAIVVAVFLDPIDRRESYVECQDVTTFSKFIATFRHMRKVNQLLLIPLTVFSGVEQAFFLSDFTRAYIACSLGIYNVGFVFICFGVVNAIMSFCSGRLVRYTKRYPIMLFGAAGNVAASVWMLRWDPDPEQYIIFFVIAGIWGFSDAIWQTQVNALYGVLFKSNEEAAFSNYRLAESLGFSIAFAYSNSLCMEAKIIIQLCFLALGFAGYTSVEYRTYSKKSYNVS